MGKARCCANAADLIRIADGATWIDHAGGRGEQVRFCPFCGTRLLVNPEGDAVHAGHASLIVKPCDNCGHGDDDHYGDPDEGDVTRKCYAGGFSRCRCEEYRERA